MPTEKETEMYQEIIDSMRLAGIPVRVISEDGSRILYPQQYHSAYIFIRDTISRKYQNLNN